MMVSSGDEVMTSAPAWNHPRVVPATTPVAVMSRPFSPRKTAAPGVRTTLTAPPVTVGATVRVGATVALPVVTVAGGGRDDRGRGGGHGHVDDRDRYGRGGGDADGDHRRGPGREEGERDERRPEQSYESVPGCCHGILT